MFATTWLSYVGFYFCRQPFSKAKGAIAATTHWDTRTLGDIWTPRNVLLGMAVSVAVTLAMGTAPTWPVMAALAGLNGLAQATGWSASAWCSPCCSAAVLAAAFCAALVWRNRRGKGI